MSQSHTAPKRSRPGAAAGASFVEELPIVVSRVGAGGSVAVVFVTWDVLPEHDSLVSGVSCFDPAELVVLRQVL